MATGLNVEESVRQRYAAGAQQAEAALCCPVEYDPRYLEVLPAEIIEKDYGCGDPSQYLKPGETVLDLGSGTGKICYIAAQVVGPTGRVIGIDMTPEMLAVAEKHRRQIGDQLGFHNVEFRRGRIQDLRTNLHTTEEYLHRHPIASVNDLQAFEAFQAEQATTQPLVADDSVDVVVSNCVLNLVHDSSKRQLFGEIFRVLRNGGRAVISDIVADEPVPAHLKHDPELWSGCISGALQEHEFLQAFADAGFYGMAVLKRDETPWRTVEGIEFRSVTVVAYKGKQGACWDCNQAVIYRGPWSEVKDDDGHTLIRGVPMAVCEKTFRLYTREPYAQDIIPVQPLTPVSLEDAQPFDCSRDSVRSPRETKGLEYRATTEAGACCEPGKCC
ncbi:MAG: methyltransferase domain-containing protein [Candidatus Binatia bacterium]